MSHHRTISTLSTTKHVVEAKKKPVERSYIKEHSDELSELSNYYSSLARESGATLSHSNSRSDLSPLSHQRTLGDDEVGLIDRLDLNMEIESLKKMLDRTNTDSLLPYSQPLPVFGHSTSNTQTKSVHSKIPVKVKSKSNFEKGKTLQQRRDEEIEEMQARVRKEEGLRPKQKTQSLKPPPDLLTILPKSRSSSEMNTTDYFVNLHMSYSQKNASSRNITSRKSRYFASTQNSVRNQTPHDVDTYFVEDVTHTVSLPVTRHASPAISKRSTITRSTLSATQRQPHRRSNSALVSLSQTVQPTEIPILTQSDLPTFVAQPQRVSTSHSSTRPSSGVTTPSASKHRRSQSQGISLTQTMPPIPHRTRDFQSFSANISPAQGSPRSSLNTSAYPTRRPVMSVSSQTRLRASSSTSLSRGMPSLPLAASFASTIHSPSLSLQGQLHLVNAAVKNRHHDQRMKNITKRAIVDQEESCKKEMEWISLRKTTHLRVDAPERKILRHKWLVLLFSISRAAALSEGLSENRAERRIKAAVYQKIDLEQQHIIHRKMVERSGQLISKFTHLERLLTQVALNHLVHKRRSMTTIIYRSLFYVHSNLLFFLRVNAFRSKILKSQHIVRRFVSSLLGRVAALDILWSITECNLLFSTPLHMCSAIDYPTKYVKFRSRPSPTLEFKVPLSHNRSQQSQIIAQFSVEAGTEPYRKQARLAHKSQSGAIRTDRSLSELQTRKTAKRTPSSLGSVLPSASYADSSQNEQYNPLLPFAPSHAAHSHRTTASSDVATNRNLHPAVPHFVPPEIRHSILKRAIREARRAWISQSDHRGSDWQWALSDFPLFRSIGPVMPSLVVEGMLMFIKRKRIAKDRE
ncbi:hypothetical protein BLNAU_2665 [Blattamonas nauphoetae]|uniref:Uncharacterized protein n=1 Tax=Blattamonas nauphoetae TaxID=2049346 RepID=A0ABQ9YF80_9EUKA|nr:hypothetical protein BLNAU_2665 [Blattamonas nauphoetae]